LQRPLHAVFDHWTSATAVAAIISALRAAEVISFASVHSSSIQAAGVSAERSATRSTTAIVDVDHVSELYRYGLREPASHGGKTDATSARDPGHVCAARFTYG
jgi:hypothetical protein